ncbi:MAG: hypothetical protein RLZZ401_2253 [Pseudomonadota bacterium]
MTLPVCDGLNSPIGVFDSGVGGLSVLRAIREALPHEHLLYVGDSAHAPYGDKPASYIEARAGFLARALLARNAKALVVACNTATVVAVQGLRSWCPVPIVAMEPAIKPATRCTRSGIVGVLATRQTLASASVKRLCALYGGDVQVMLQACPGWVEQIERADLSSAQTRNLVEASVMPLVQAGVDTLVLGCTHYPFLRTLIQQIAGPGVTLIDPAAAIAQELSRRLEGQARPPAEPPASELFLTTGEPEAVQAVIGQLWGCAVPVGQLFDQP